MCAFNGQDLIVPAFKPPTALQHSPYRPGSQAHKRDLLLFFMGDFRDGAEDSFYQRYSRFIRQGLRLIARQKRWWEQYRIFIGTREDGPPNVTYGQLLASSVFCLVVPGDKAGLQFAHLNTDVQIDHVITDRRISYKFSLSFAMMHI